MHAILLLPNARATATHAHPDDLWTRTVGGVGWLKRQARLLRAVGADRVVVVGGPTDRDALASVSVGRLAVTERVETLVLDPDAPVDARAAQLAGLFGAAAGSVIMLAAEQAVERGALKEAAAARPGARDLLVARTPDREAVALAVAGASRLADAAAWLLATPLLAGDAAPAWPDDARPLPLPEREIVGVITDEASRAAVEHTLWERCRKPIDGIVSRNLNRHISLFISRRIAHTPITPNHISTVTLILGVVGALLAAQGTYWFVLLGAFLLKANSVLDGVDGELARMRIQSSVLGEWLDTISDDISNQAFFFAVGWGAYTVSGDIMWLWLAALAVVPLLLTSAIYYTWLIRIGRGDILAFDWFHTAPRTPGQLARRSAAERVTDVLTQVFRRDSFVMMLFVMAIFGVVQHSLFVVAVAGWITFAALVVRSVRGRAVARAAATTATAPTTASDTA